MSQIIHKKKIFQTNERTNIDILHVDDSTVQIASGNAVRVGSNKKLPARTAGIITSENTVQAFFTQENIVQFVSIFCSTVSYTKKGSAKINMNTIFSRRHDCHLLLFCDKLSNGQKYKRTKKNIDSIRFPFFSSLFCHPVLITIYFPILSFLLFLLYLFLLPSTYSYIPSSVFQVPGSISQFPNS